MKISGNLSKQPFSRGSGRITLKNCLLENIFVPENPQILGCRFLDALVVIRGFLLYTTCSTPIRGFLLLRCTGCYSRVFTVYYLLNPNFGVEQDCLLVAVEYIYIFSFPYLISIAGPHQPTVLT